MDRNKALNSLALELKNLPNENINNLRKKHKENKLYFDINNILKSTVSKMANKKGLQNVADEMEQITYIAISNAIVDWDIKISSFSTYVHWQLLAEAKRLELHLHPERRNVCKNIDVILIPLNKPKYSEYYDSNEEYVDKIIDNENTDIQEYNIGGIMAKSSIDKTLSRLIYNKMMAFYKNPEKEKKSIIDYMRNVHIFRQTYIDEIELKDIALIHGITRERIRQVNQNLLDSFTKKIMYMSKNKRPETEEESQFWLDAISIYKEEKQVDIRYSDTKISDDKLPTMVEIDLKKMLYLQGMQYNEIKDYISAKINSKQDIEKQIIIEKDKFTKEQYLLNLEIKSNNEKLTITKNIDKINVNDQSLENKDIIKQSKNKNNISYIKQFSNLNYNEDIYAIELGKYENKDAMLNHAMYLKKNLNFLKNIKLFCIHQNNKFKLLIKIRNHQQIDNFKFNKLKLIKLEQKILKKKVA